ncbi:YbjN domain-containing protein [Corynebacterium epidermidicanis]|uniref:Putative bacterial sensory transduction regulator n=1 Tax=Corynebacterium epidermidicanis TaxID=1050174 RepID=A0A0G3GSU3_9CORY|nr:YbjN domain-containing protein [Corynebacterium epidermidicanis]AKK04246.1 Putative bacterial sensory transduction regulator [Corynebacterium epidermidicanis]
MELFDIDPIDSRDIVTPVSAVRAMGALTDIGIMYRVDDDDPNDFYAHFAGFVIHFTWDGPFEPGLLVSARLWGRLPERRLADFQRWMVDFHAGSFQPIATYQQHDDGIHVVFRTKLSLKGGLSDSQLTANVKRLIDGIIGATSDAATEFPELAATEPGFLSSIDEENQNLILPVTLERLPVVLTALEVEDIESDGVNVVGRYGDREYACKMFAGGLWLQMRSEFEYEIEPQHLGEFTEFANKKNSEWRDTAVYIEELGENFRLVFESNTPVHIGMTTAQLGEALRDSLWGQDRLARQCHEELDLVDF